MKTFFHTSLSVRIVVVRIVVLASLVANSLGARGEDWPMWRYGPQRGGASPAALPKSLKHAWTRQLEPPRTAWPKNQLKLQFDASPQPVVVSQRLFLPSTVNDTVTAYDTRSGRRVWTFSTEGPVRFAPVVFEERVYFVSDDGHLYCVSAADGSLLWKVRGGPGQRPVLGNRRLVSSWPARGGPVYRDGKIYFAASIWPFMGIFVHAVDATSGKVIWTNSGDGTNYTIQPHGAPSFATVCPQGHLVATADEVIVPGGRSTPAVFDALSGRMKHFSYDKKRGSHDVMASGQAYFVAGSAFLLSDGKPAQGDVPLFATTQQATFAGSDADAIVVANSQAREYIAKSKDRKGKEIRINQVLFDNKQTWKLADSVERWLLRCGDQCYGLSKMSIVGYQLDPAKKSLQPFFRQPMDQPVHSAIAADSRLFVVCGNMEIRCYATKDQSQNSVQHYPLPEEGLTPPDDKWDRYVDSLQPIETVPGGYAVLSGIGQGQLLKSLLKKTALRLIVIEPDRTKLLSWRLKLRRARLYGRRVSLHHGNPARFPLPRYMATLVAGEALPSQEAIAHLYRALRPYGGRLAFPLAEQQRQQLGVIAKAVRDPQLNASWRAGLAVIRRRGALPGSDNWTHQYANASQSVVSTDKLVKAPLGILWFGGSTNEAILPRHGHGPSPQVADGRIVIEGPNMLRAMDVYTGRVLWEAKMPGLGDYYNTTRHFPGAGEIGSNYVTLGDRVYVAYGPELVELDAATGKRTSTRFRIGNAADSLKPNWGFIAVSGDYLVATTSPVSIATRPKNQAKIPALPRGNYQLIERNERWQYLAGEHPKSAAWTRPDFTAKGWKAGPAGFGLGDGDDETLLAMIGLYRTVYARRSFHLDAPKKLEKLALVISYDDAFIAYLNGQEILRVGVKTGRGKSARSITSHEAAKFELFQIKNFRPLLREGENVLAIEGHNESLTSSDFSLDPYLIGVGKGALKVLPKKKVVEAPPVDEVNKLLGNPRYGTGSRHLAVFHRKSGKLLWSRDAKANFRHNNIAIGNGMVFCIDSLTEAKLKVLSRRGLDLPSKPVLYALDLATGNVVWKNQEFAYGTFINYSTRHDLVIQAGSKYRDRAVDENGVGMMAFRGATGDIAWQEKDLKYGGPCLLWRDKILTNGGGGFALDIKTGNKTGWKYTRAYGCNTAIGSEHLLTFRSGAAGFLDLLRDGGTGNLGGFRSSCTNNLIPANGVLNAPDYTRTCNCAYQNQTSLALIHMPSAEYWTYGATAGNNPVGVNFGAPGDRRDDGRTLWVEFPVVAGSSVKVPVTIQPAKPVIKRVHSSKITGQLRWVAASAASGVQRLRFKLPKRKKAELQLVFAELENVAAGQRVFDVLVQGKTVLGKLDVVATAGGRHRSVVRRFPVDVVNGEIVVEFQSRTRLPAIISGAALE